MMLVHIGQADVAERVTNAWLKTIEDGIHTYDIYDESVSKQKVGTREFARAVVERLGQRPETLKAVTYNQDVGDEAGYQPNLKRAEEKTDRLRRLPPLVRRVPRGTGGDAALKGLGPRS